MCVQMVLTQSPGLDEARRSSIYVTKVWLDETCVYNPGSRRFCGDRDLNKTTGNQTRIEFCGCRPHTKASEKSHFHYEEELLELAIPVTS